MKHYVAYHSVEKMGGPLGTSSFGFVTKKPVQQMVDSRAWAIEGEGQPRSYRLVATWIADSAGPVDDDEFANFVDGTVGEVFEPRIELRSLPWFPAFLKSQSNFSIGIATIKEQFVAEFEKLREGRAGTRLPSVSVSEEPRSQNGDEAFFEGAATQVTTTKYERDPRARQACIELYGAACLICGFDFKAVYGPRVSDRIHVHHIEQLAGRKRRKTVPGEDLIPVCPNCHAVLHSRVPPLSPDEVRALLDR